MPVDGATRLDDTARVPVLFYYDVVCPFAYLAAERARSMEPLAWRPILLGGLLRDVGAAIDPNAAMPAAKARLVRADALRWADLAGVPLRWPAEHPRRTLAAMRLLAIVPDRVRTTLSRALFRAYWVEGLDVADPAVVDRIASEHGLEAGLHERDEAKQTLRRNTDEAARAGAFGVPTFVFDDGQLSWGVDRMWMVARRLGQPGADPLRVGDPAQWQAPSRPPNVQFFHDFASPFSYLASTRIEHIAAARGVTVDWTPILLGALFRAIGTPEVPLFAMAPAKQAFVRRDLETWADAWGVPFTFPRHFPMRSLLPLRVALVEPSTTAAMYRAAWAEDRRIDDPVALAEVLVDAGFDATEVLAAAEAEPIKARLRANTEAAVQAGVCGVPSCLVTGDERPPVLLWGQDRLGQLAAVLDGWRPPQ